MSFASAVALAIAVPAGTRLAARARIRTAVTTGLLAMTAGLPTCATQSVLASLPPDRLGAGSAVNNTTRNLGSAAWSAWVLDSGVSATATALAGAVLRDLNVLSGGAGDVDCAGHWLRMSHAACRA